MLLLPANVLNFFLARWRSSPWHTSPPLASFLCRWAFCSLTSYDPICWEPSSRPARSPWRWSLWTCCSLSPCNLVKNQENIGKASKDARKYHENPMAFKKHGSNEYIFPWHVFLWAPLRPWPEARLRWHGCFMRDLCQESDSMFLFHAFNPILDALGAKRPDIASWRDIVMVAAPVLS